MPMDSTPLICTSEVTDSSSRCLWLRESRLSTRFASRRALITAFCLPMDSTLSCWYSSHAPASARLCARTSEGWLPCKPLLALPDDDTERLRAPLCTSVEIVFRGGGENFVVRKSLPESEPPRRVLRLMCLPCPVQDATIRDLHSESISLPGTTAVLS
ncbi:Uncharacterised protein [Enterobacter cloacae]|nr:Uncharacterised protein [Enterobacter cloacae]